MKTQELLTTLISQGYAILENHFDPDLVIQALHNSLKKISPIYATQETRYPNLLGLDPVFENLIADATIIDLARQTLGEVINLSDVEIVTLHPGAPGVNPHLDYPYVLMNEVFSSPILSLQTIWVLNDMTEENGATMMVPGSHFKAAWPDASYSADSSKLLLKRGSVVITHGALWHSTASNQSQQDRSNLLITFVPPWIQPLSPVWKNIDDKNLSPLMRELLGHDNRRFLIKKLEQKQHVKFTVNKRYLPISNL